MSSASLGDAIRALARGAPGDEAARLALLGWTLREAAPPPPRAVVAPVTVPSPSPRWERAPTVSHPTAGSDLRIEPIRPARTRTPTQPIPVTASGRLPPPEPLLEPTRARSLVGALAGRRQPDGALDVEALVRAIAAQRPLTGLRRRLRPSLRRGVVVAVDAGDPLAPFRDDVRWLVSQIERWVWPERLAVARFRGVPTALDRGEGPEPWMPAPDAPTLLVLTGPGASITSWSAFAREMAAMSWVVLSPFPASRWPAELAASLPLVPWERGLTAGRIRAARR